MGRTQRECFPFGGYVLIFRVTRKRMGSTAVSQWGRTQMMVKWVASPYSSVLLISKIIA